MQRIILAFLLFCVVQANAIYVSTSIGDSRIQSKNLIYKPGGIVHWALETGFFNEPENIIDYKLGIGIDRFGYSHSDGDESVSLWELYFKPMIWSVTYQNVMLEFAPYAGILIAGNNLNEYDEDLFFKVKFLEGGHIITIGYEYRLGYQISNKYFVGLTANYHYVPYGFQHYKPPSHVKKDLYLFGGWGLNFQYNVPW